MRTKVWAGVLEADLARREKDVRLEWSVQHTTSLCQFLNDYCHGQYEKKRSQQCAEKTKLTFCLFVFGFTFGKEARLTKKLAA